MKKINFWENFVLVAIVLVIVQTFIDELSRYQHWSIDAKNIILFAGLLFDTIFSIEFIVRSISSHRKLKNVLRYWIYERGWVDFFSSIPLLLLDSGPSVYILLSGNLQDGAAAIGAFNVLKVVKAIRVTRILRLVRIIKIFGKIHNAESKMAQHHTASIATTAVFTIICTLMIFSIITENPITKNINIRKELINNEITKIREIHKKSKIPSKVLAEKFLSDDTNLLKIYYKKDLLFSHVSDEEFKDYYSFEDYSIITNGNFTIYTSHMDINRQIAFEHIQNFFIIVITVFAFMLVYTRHFVQTISDIVHILIKGFGKKNYNLQVKIRDEYEDEEIFKLAKFYNDIYLPAKLKRIQEEDEKKSSGLSMNDLMDFNK